MRNFLKQESINFNPDQFYERCIKRFALTDSLYKGTALTANILFCAILIQLPQLSKDNILLSTYFHFLFLAFLEIPTSFIADIYSSTLITKFGFFLKFLSTTMFFFLVYFTFKHDFNLGILFLISESFLDGLANSLLSGAYQSAFFKKFKADGLDTSKLFVDSMRYSVPVRLLIPIIGLIIFYFLDFNIEYQMYSLVLYVVLLRVLVFARVIFELRNVVYFKRNHVDLSTYFSVLLSDLKLNKSIILFASFYSFLSSISASYFLPNLQLLLSPSTTKFGVLQGSLLGFFFYFKVTVLGWLILKFKFLSNMFLSHHSAITVIILASFAFMLSMYVIGDSLKLFFQYTSVFFIYISSYFGLRLAMDVIGVNSEESTEAGLISSFETLGMLAFCIVSLMGFFLNRSEFYLYLISLFILIGTTLYFYANSKKIAAKIL